MRKWTRIFAIGLLILISITIIPAVVIYVKQDRIVSEMIEVANEEIAGKIILDGSHITLVHDFPNISIDLEGLKIYEERNDSLEQVMDLQDAYLSFDPWSIIRGGLDLKKVTISNGTINLIQHADSTLNIANVFLTKSEEQEEEEGEGLDLSIDEIELVNVDIIKISETNNLLVEAFIEQLNSTISYSPEHFLFGIEGSLLSNVVMDGDTTFFHHKHLFVDAKIDFNTSQRNLIIEPSLLRLENGEIEMAGSVDFANDGYLDLALTSKKKNFDLLMAFAPPEIAPALEKYENGGDIFFDSQIKGKSINGYAPSVKINFGCEQAYFNNTVSDKAINDLEFKGSFIADNLADLSTMSFKLQDFTAKPEAGDFKGLVSIENFDSPDIEVQLNSSFNLDFLTEFFGIDDLQDLSGEIDLSMNFHDIIDLQDPEKSIERLNESYFTTLEIRNLSFNSPDFHLPFSDINLSGKVEGHEARIDNLSMRIGSSDVKMQASISDLPAIIHHSAIPVEVMLNVAADNIDLKELTRFDTLGNGIDERIENLSVLFSFESSARAFTESPNLPLGEFFIDSLYADLQNYPHLLHDFHADIIVDSTDFKVIDFSGMIDESDFHFDGRLSNYDLWFQESPKGDTRVDFFLKSKMLRLEDLFSYNGENYVPEDYRHEELDDLLLKGHVEMHFDSILYSSDLYVDDMQAQMKIHPMPFKDFGGRFHLEKKKLTVTGFRGRLGNSDFVIDYTKDLSENSADTSMLSFTSAYLDFDELFNYNPPPADKQMTPADHEDVFNIFDLPFDHLHMDVNIDKMNYHRYALAEIELSARMQPDHYIYLDTVGLMAANGKIYGKGYFNGSNRDLIYLSPEVKIEDVALEKLLFKFENFGQDYLVSDNLSGQLNAGITGKIHIHPDMVPIIDDSDLMIDVLVTEGELKKFAPMEIMADYFSNKNLNLVRFDTLQNQLKFSKGALEIPKMNINSTLGFFEISGTQKLNLEMDYLLSIPVKLVGKAAWQKLFGGKNKVATDQEDEIQYRDTSKKVMFLNVKLTGTPDNYNIKLGD